MCRDIDRSLTHFLLVHFRKSQICEPRFRLLLLRRELSSHSASTSSHRNRDELESGSLEDEPEYCYRVHELNFELNLQQGR